MDRTAIKLLGGAALLIAGAASALAEVHYVDVNSTNATPPYTNWATAATNIQDAVDAAVAGDEVLVTNGTYSSLNLDKPVNVSSINGPQLTRIDGGGLGGCAYLINGASLSGFTLTNGYVYDDYGAGVLCDSGNAVVSNCVITGNRAFGDFNTMYVLGGGAYGVTLNNCTITNNTVRASLRAVGGGYTSILAGGGGAAYCTLNNCTLIGNSAGATNIHALNEGVWAFGGGAYECTLKNCALSSNSVLASGQYYGATEGHGGATAYCSLSNCTLTGNIMTTDSPVLTSGGVGGAYGSTLNSCIVYFNSVRSFYGSLSDDNYDPYGGPLSYCCTTPQPVSGFGNITNAPLFVDLAGGDLRLQSNSPCINAGNNAFAPAGPDLDGNPRIVGGTVDIGAYEYQSLSLINFSVVSNQAGFNITGQPNQVVIVETSGDLVNWSPLATNTLSGHPFSFSDPTPANLPRRFYRAQPQ